MKQTRFVAAALTACVCALAGQAAAEEKDSPKSEEAPAAEQPSPARVLFKEGRELASAGNYAAACPKFEESLRLEVGVGTQFNLADCWEHIGRTASAHSLFLGAAASAKASGQRDREQVLRDRAVALEPRLTKLVIDVEDTTAKLSVRRDALPIEAEAWGKAIAVDPGKYDITAKAPGKKPWSKPVEVRAGQQVVTVTVPKLEDDEPPPLPPAKPVAQETKPAPEPERGGGPNYKAIGLGAFGVVSLGVGIGMGVRYKSANDDAKSICPSNSNCTQSDIEKHDELVDKASTSRGWAYAGVTVGALSLVGAAALFIFEKPAPAAQQATHAKPTRLALRPLTWLGENGRWGGGVDATF
jgi:hypothetical protein